MHYHIILTELCNSKCRYCYEKSMCEENDLNKRFKFDFDAPFVSAVATEKIKEFLSRDKEPTLVFYGGEPLLQLDRIKELIDSLSDVPNIKFRMQTNGKLLDKLEMKYLKKIGKILVSIDGTRERTDFNKGEGTYDKVIGNLRKIRREGYDGEIVARMCVSGFPDIYEQAMHLIGLIRAFRGAPVVGAHPPAPNDLQEISKVSSLQGSDRFSQGIFDSIHWQLDVGFYSCDYERRKVKKFFEEYNKSVTKLAEWWFGEMKKGKVWKLYPFVGLTENLLQATENLRTADLGFPQNFAYGEKPNSRLCSNQSQIRSQNTLALASPKSIHPKQESKICSSDFLDKSFNKKTKLMCGAGHSGYTITTDGNLVACPIMGCMPDFYCGNLDSSPKDLKKIYVSGRCAKCEYLDECGGRCLYANSVKLWPEEGLDLVCGSVKHLIDLLKTRLPEIQELIEKEIIGKKDFEYEKYFGPEIVP